MKTEESVVNPDILEVRRVDGVWRVAGYLTSYEYAKKHNVKEGTVRKWIRFGKLEAVQIGTGWWIKEDEPVPPNISKMKAEERESFMEREGRKLTAIWHSENGSGWKKR